MDVERKHVFMRAVIVLLASAMGAGSYAIAQSPAGLPSPSEAPETRMTPMQAPAFSGSNGPMWGKGQHLPPEYRQTEFDNWQAYHLREAPEGYRWVRVDRGAYRVRAEDGYIAEAIFGLPAN